MKLVPLQVFVIAIAIGLSSSSQPFGESAECGVSQVWNETFETYVDTDVRIEVTVNEDSYEIFDQSFQDNTSLGEFVQKQAAFDTSTYYVPAQILVRSDEAISCQRFREAIQEIERNYPCEKANRCFAAYGLGKSFLPPSITPPPPDVPNR